MPRKMFLGLLLLVGCASGCANTYSIARLKEDAVSKVSITNTFCITVSKEGTYDRSKYSGIDSLLSKTLQSSLEERGIVPDVSRPYLNFYDALTQARTNDCDYLIFAKILGWKDHAVELDGRPSTMEIEIQMMDTSSGMSVDTALVRGKSAHVFFGDSADDLLPIAVDKFFSRLF